jgi:hypothetical protein
MNFNLYYPHNDYLSDKDEEFESGFVDSDCDFDLDFDD